MLIIYGAVLDIPATVINEITMEDVVKAVMLVTVVVFLAVVTHVTTTFQDTERRN